MIQHNILLPSGKFLSAATLHKVLKKPLYVKSSDAVFKYRENDGINVFGTPDGIHGILNYNRTSISIRNGKKSNSYKDKSEWIASVSKICKGFIEHDIWLEVQKQINTNKFKAPNLGNTNNAILTGKLICGSCRSHTWVIQGHINKDTSLPKIYYKCNQKKRSSGIFCSSKNLTANKIKKCMLDSLTEMASNKKDFLSKLQNM